MPDLVEQMYCSQQIFIPPNLPSILKKYAKAAIRTQPGDLLAWSSAYFRALADGIPPPAKDRIEYPPVDTPSGLSPGFLKVLINQIGKRETVHKDVLAERWKGVCLNANALQDLLDVGLFEDDVSWLEFLAICVGTLEPSLTRTMIELCELLTEEPEGGRAAIPVTIFLNLYKYLAKLDCGPVNRLEDYEKALKADSETQCQATDLKPTEEEKEPQEANIDWDTAIGDESGGDDPDGRIVVEAADIENDQNGQDEENGEQEEIANTEKKSPELAEAKSEENGEVNEEEVKKIEVADDAQSVNAFEEAGLKETEVSKEPEEGVGEGLNVDEQMEENKTQKDESADIKVDGNDTTEDEKQEEPDNEKAEDGVNEADYMDNGENNGGAKEETDEDAVANGNESPLEEDDAAKIIKEEDPTDPGRLVDEAADATSPGKEDDDGKNDAEAVTADVSQLEGAIDEPAGVDDGQGEGGKNESDGQTTDETEKDATNTSANEGIGASSDEAYVDVENRDEPDEPPDAIDDTKDIKVGSPTSDEIPVESTGSPSKDGKKDETEERVLADEGNEASTTPVMDESAPGANKELAEGAQDEVTAPAGDGDKENPVEAPNGDDTNDKSGAELDLASATSADETSQDQAEGDVARNGEVEKDDPSVNQEKTEELAADETKDQDGSTGAVDNLQSAANKTAEAGSEETSVDGNEPENTESAADAIPEESATDKTSGTENVKQTAEDENGNENKSLQEKSVLSVEETIDPKSAYIVNDDGTLSAPRAESVLDEDALKERDSDISVYTKRSDDGMMVWPDIKPQEKEEAETEPLLEKEVTSEDGIEVFTDIEMQPHQEELKLLPEQQEEEVEAEQEENIFAPQIDSFTDLIEAESAPVEEANPEQLAAALESMIIGTEMTAEETGMVVTSDMIGIETAESDEAASLGPAEPANGTEAKAVEQDQKKEKKPRRQKKDVEIETLVKKDSDMMLLPTPITSDIMLYMDGACDKTAVKLNQTQQLYHKMSMIDVQVSVPVDATIVEVVEHHRYPKWMHIPGIGPTVPDHIIEEAEKYFLKISELQEGMVMPRNIKHFHCPPLELIADCPEEILN